MNVPDVYERLLAHFGHQEWWPMSGKFSPKELEVCIGAILTQNTNWKNVEKALKRMTDEKMTTAESIVLAKDCDLEEAVRPSGFYKQKAERLKIFSRMVIDSGGFSKFSQDVTRDDLLGTNGLGPETADSMLLYAFARPVFVIDAYTKRIFTRLGFDDMKGYEEWRSFFEENVRKDVELYKEFHALIVEHAKKFCRTKPLCENCVFTKTCTFASSKIQSCSFV